MIKLIIRYIPYGEDKKSEAYGIHAGKENWLDVKVGVTYWGIFCFLFFRIFLGLQHLCVTTDSFVRELM